MIEHLRYFTSRGRDITATVALTRLTMAGICTFFGGFYGFIFGLLAFGGGGGGGKEAPAYSPPPPPPPPPAPPTVDSAQVQADIDAINRRRAAATGLSATDRTQGALAGDPTSLSTKKPTLLGGGTTQTTTTQ
jgi:hypothetical protein